MATNTRIIFANTGGSATYYLAGPGTPYTGVGAPWAAQATSPFRLGLNDVTGNIYTPAPAPSMPILGGGPPFRNGRSLITKSYDVVTETVGIQMYATSPDNAAVLLQLLRQILNLDGFTTPAILAVQPDGWTHTTYFEIYHATVAEMHDYLWENHTGFAIFRAAITWTRSIGSAGALETAINGVSMRNRSTGSPNDVEALGAITGDLIYEGQPLNVNLASSTNTFGRIFLATVAARVATSIAQSKTTTSATAYTAATPAISDARDRNLKVRILARFDTFTAPSKIRLRCDVDYGNGTYTLKTFPTQALPNSAAVSTLIDFGDLDIRPIRSIDAATLAIQIRISLISSDGTSVTARLDYVETLLYHTFAVIDDAAIGSGRSVVAEGANNYNDNSVWTPNVTPRLYATVTADGTLVRQLPYRGTLPRAYDLDSLYVAWLKSAGGTNDTHDTADTMSVTVKHLPLYHTLHAGT